MCLREGGAGRSPDGGAELRDRVPLAREHGEEREGPLGAGAGRRLQLQVRVLRSKKQQRRRQVLLRFQQRPELRSVVVEQKVFFFYKKICTRSGASSSSLSCMARA